MTWWTRKQRKILGGGNIKICFQTRFCYALHIFAFCISPRQGIFAKAVLTLFLKNESFLPYCHGNFSLAHILNVSEAYLRDSPDNKRKSFVRWNNILSYRYSTFVKQYTLSTNPFQQTSQTIFKSCLSSISSNAFVKWIKLLMGFTLSMAINMSLLNRAMRGLQMDGFLF